MGSLKRFSKNKRIRFVPFVYAVFMLMSLFEGDIFCSVLEASRIKDLTSIRGSRDNQLVGYGLVIGLAGKGDKKLTYTVQSLANSLRAFGMNVPASTLNSKNVAAVMITCDIPPFIKEGARLDVTVSSIGDAETLQGGILLQAPLKGADGLVYAVAQGPIDVGGFLGGSGGEGGSSVQQNHPTVGTIPGGAIVEREIETAWVTDNQFDFLLTNPDFTSAVRLAEAINNVYPSIAQAMDSVTVNVKIPEMFQAQHVNFIAALGGIQVIPDTAARVIFNPRTGTIVATSEVRISRVAVSHGSLTISIASNSQASQPNPLSQGQTQVLNSTQTTVDEDKGGFKIIDDLPTIERLTSALNALGVSSREMMTILQAIKSAGALQAELIIE